VRLSNLGLEKPRFSLQKTVFLGLKHLRFLKGLCFYALRLDSEIRPVTPTNTLLFYTQPALCTYPRKIVYYTKDNFSERETVTNDGANINIIFIKLLFKITKTKKLKEPLC